MFGSYLPSGERDTSAASSRALRACWPLRIVLVLAAGALILTNVRMNGGPAPARADLVRREQITYFYDARCENCAQAEVLIRAYAARHPEVPLRAYDMDEQHSQELRRAYDASYGVPRWKQQGVPAAFVQDDARLGLADIEGLLAGAPPRDSTLSSGGWLQTAAERYAPIALRSLLVIALLTAAILAGAERASLRARFRVAVRLFLAAVLLVAALWKATHVTEVADLLRDTWDLGPSLFAAAWLGTWAVIAAEGTVAALLVVGRPRRVFPCATLLMYATFLGYSLLARVLSLSGDCGCFPWPESLGWAMIARNAGFLMLSYLLLESSCPGLAVPATGGD
jgi:hypothetical protein